MARYLTRLSAASACLVADVGGEGSGRGTASDAGDDGGWRQPAREVSSSSSKVTNLLSVWRTQGGKGWDSRLPQRFLPRAAVQGSVWCGVELTRGLEW